MFLRRLLKSRANENIVLSCRTLQQQKENIFHQDSIVVTLINAPRINVPITLTGNVLKIKGDSVTLYLRNIPSTDPLQEKQIPNPSSISYTPTDVISAI